MNYRETDDECPSCGATVAERRLNYPNGPHGLEMCPHCNAGKCCICDMGDDVKCISCDDGCPNDD